MSDIASITLRLPKDVSDRFKELTKQKDISQGKLLEELLDLYEKGQTAERPMLEEMKNNEIRLLLRYQNDFLEAEELRVREPKIYVFRGENIFGLQQGKNIENSDALERLRQEFSINESLENYYCGYWFGILRDLDKGRFVINEWFWVTDRLSQKVMLSVRRCKFANNLGEILAHIGKYAYLVDIEYVEFLLAEKVESDQEVENFL